MTRSIAARLVVLAGLGALTACGGAEDGTGDERAAELADELAEPLVATTPEGAVTTFGPLTAYCLPHDDNPDVTSLWVTTDLTDDRDARLMIEMDVDYVEQGRVVEAPYGVEYGKPEEAAIFVAIGRGRDGLENSTSEEESTGSFEVVRAGCDEGDPVQIVVDAALGSELGGGPVKLRGGIDLEVQAPPAYMEE